MNLGFWQRLFRRWFIEFNPLYLLSAACVLVGVNRLSGALAQSAYSALTIAAVAEIYAWSLIASAALLTRVRLRRPAVMLALLTALYQCDPTLHTETCAYLGWGGAAASLFWLASFAAKLRALAWALELRVSLSAFVIPLCAALGLVAMPYLVQRVGSSTMSSLVALWVFGLFAGALWSARRITSAVWLNSWGRTVLRRCVRATWALWAALLLAHVAFWAQQFDLALVALLPVPLLLSTRWARRELQMWLSVAAALGLAALTPRFFAAAALMAAVTLLLRALKRASHGGERTRLFAGALYTSYLALWTLGSEGSLPASHRLWLDALLTLALLGLAWKQRPRHAALLPLLPTYIHCGVEARWLFLPRNTLEWALAYVGLGFTLLFMSLSVSLHWRHAQGEPEPPDAEQG